MKTILHYSIGFNSDRGGGLSKYSTDLLLGQKKIYKPILLFPGNMTLGRKKSIIQCPSRDGIENYKIINPLPLLFMCGINDERYLHEKSDVKMWITFLQKIKPNIFHIHTLMGLNIECIEAAKILNIPIVYTSHDYFGICPKQTLFYYDHICHHANDFQDCPICNHGALSSEKLFILHSSFFIKIRKMKFVLILKNLFKRNTENKLAYTSCSNIDFFALRKKYVEIFSMIDFIHFNSSITELVFKNYIPQSINQSKIISITHKAINDHRKSKLYNHNILRLTYLGSDQFYKGLPFLIDILDEIYEANKNFQLTIYCNVKYHKQYLRIGSVGYNYQDLGEIFSNTDLLLVPSQWYEPFAFVVREAMSYGVPVMVTDTVGARDIIEDGQTGIIAPSDKWKELLLYIIEHKSFLCFFNQNILQGKFYSFEDHLSDLENIYSQLF
jgi:glycosyltransferase involved in cell wall biosynthesis